MKTIYLALVAFFAFSTKLIIKPDLFTALSLGFSAVLLCLCEYLDHQKKTKLSQEESESVENKYKILVDKVESMQSEIASVKLSKGFSRR